MGEEYARISLNGILVLNEQALYIWILRAATQNKGKIPTTIINKAFSATGSWGRDPSVEGSLRNLEELNLLQVYRDDTGDITSVWPLAAPHTALKKIPYYTTRAEVLAGLEQLNER
jgi:hypothetical protein